METRKKTIFTLVCLLVLFAFLLYANSNFNAYINRIINLCAIYTILGLGMNLINGFTGLFSLGHAGFMAVGAYTTAILTLPPDLKERNFFMQPIWEPLANLNLPIWEPFANSSLAFLKPFATINPFFFVALVLAGVLSAVIAFIIGAPALRLKGDYLAIATLGFAEIIRVVFNNTQNITNGSLGLKSIPPYTNIWWSYGVAVLTILFLVKLMHSSYGKAIMAIREDEIAAEAMGINLYKHKAMSFMIGAFFAGVGGGLLGNLIGAVDPQQFRFTLTFNILLIIVLGGMGSISGTVIGAFIITIAQEVLRFLDEPFEIAGRTFQVSGLRMVIFSLALMVVVIYFKNGLMGYKELSFDKIFGRKKDGSVKN